MVEDERTAGIESASENWETLCAFNLEGCFQSIDGHEEDSPSGSCSGSASGLSANGKIFSTVKGVEKGEHA